MPITLGLDLNLGGSQQTFSQFQSSLQQTFNDRNSLSTTLSQTGSTSTDPALTQSALVYSQNSTGNLVFDTNINYVSLQTMDTYSVQAQATYLTGLTAAKVPLLPMTFNVVLPPVALAAGISTPTPLTIFVNPKTWSRSINKKNTNTFTRGGYKSERWGDELEQIDASGEIAGFYTETTGLTRYSRSQTPSYGNFMQLVQIFKNNGCVYGTTQELGLPSPSPKTRISDVGFIEIMYGYEIFIGTFDSMTIKESAEKPFNLSYSFTFHVGKIISIYDATSLTSSINIPTNTGGLDVSQDVQTLYQQSIAAQNVNQSNNLNPTTNNVNVLNLPGPSTGLLGGS